MPKWPLYEEHSVLRDEGGTGKHSLNLHPSPHSSACLSASLELARTSRIHPC